MGVVFTEPKESEGGEKLPTETKGGLITTQTTSTTTTIISSHTSSPPLSSHDDSRPQRRHERSFSQASNIVSTTSVVESETSLGHVIDTGTTIEDNVKPYSERKQFWETVTSHSLETKSPMAKSETESDTDTGTDGTVIEKSSEKESLLPEYSDSDADSSQRKEQSVYENVTFRRKGPDKQSAVSSQDFPSPDDMSLKDVKTKKEMFEKEIKRQSSELEESLGWKRSSKELEEESDKEVPKTSTFVKEEITISSDISAINEKHTQKKISEQQVDSAILKTLEKTDKEHTELSELTKEEKLKYEKTVIDDKKVTEKEMSSKKDVDKEVKDDRAKICFKSIESKDDGSVIKTKVKEASKVHVSHEQLEGKSETIVINYDKEKGETSRHEQSSTSSVDFKESTSSNVIRSEVKFALGTTSQLSSTDTTDSTNGSFERSDSTKESFDKSYSTSGTVSSISKKQSILNSSGDDHELPEFPEDSSVPEIQTRDDNRLVEKKVEEERRKFGDTEELLVREITTIREGGQEQRVVKETKTQETLMPDGSTIKTTSVTTFTTQLDRRDSEDTADHSEDSASSPTEREKSEVLLKQQIKADIFAEGLQEQSDEISPEHKLLSPKESKKVAFDSSATSITSPIQVPEESVQEIVWETFQEQSEAPVSETVQCIGDDEQVPSEASISDSKTEEPTKIILNEEEARAIAEEIVEEVKQEALKRSSLSDKDVIVNRLEIERQQIVLPKTSSAAAFTTETSDKIEKYIQEKLTDEKLDPHHLTLIESVTAKKTEMLQKRLGTHEFQLSLEITDEDLQSSAGDADLSPIEHQMERLRQMTEDEDQTKSGREPSEADESESSLIIHDSLEDGFTSGYDQANQMFNKTLDTVKSVNLKGERVISTISEEADEAEKHEVDTSDIALPKTRKKSREELKEAAIEIVKEVTDKAKESEAVKQAFEQEKDEDSIAKEKKSQRDDLKQERSLDIPMESSMTESVEECSAAESTRAYDARYATEMTKTSIQEVAEHDSDKKPTEKISPPTEEIRLRKKTHIDEFNRRSGADFDAYSSSGESHYFTAGEGTDSRSVSRPCSSDVEMLLSATPGTSEYDTALTSQEGSSSRDFSTAPSSISSRDSMKSIDSESSGNLGSIELSEASETLVPSTLDLEKDMEILDKELLEEELMQSEERAHTVIPQLTIHSGTPKSEDIPSPFGETETDDMEDDTKSDDIPCVSSKMKRSVEMTFHPEPKIIKGDDEDFAQPTLEESTVSNMSVITVVERSQGALESSDTTMSLSSISNQTAPTVETRDVSTEQVTKPEDETSKISDTTTTSVTITATSIPPSRPDDPTASMCTQVTSEVRTEKTEESFFRANGPTEVEFVAARSDDAVNAERLAGAPVCSDQEPIGAAGGHSVGPDSSYSESYEPEADQEYGHMIREGEDQYLEEAELQRVIDSQPEDDMSDKRFEIQESIERPKTPEPGSISKLRIKTSQDSEELTEVDKRFSAIFSVTYEEPASPAPVIQKASTEIVPNITITEHMAPIDGRYRYPDLECDDEFPECRTNGIESGSHSTPSSVTSPKSSTTDSEHGREYCLDSQTEGPVQYSDYGSFELVEAAEIQDLDEYRNTLIRHEKRIRELTIKEEDEASSPGSKKEESPILPPATLRAIKLDSESPSSSGDGDLSKDTEEPYSSSIEEQRRWLEMQFEESSEKSGDFDFSQQAYEHIYSGPLEDIEEEREEYERRDLTHLTKTPSLSSTPEYDVLAGRKFFTRSGDQDDISMSSLQEFEKFEREMAIENATRRSSSGSQESLNGKRPGSGNKSHGDDISVSSFSSLNEFERLEKECIIVEQIEAKVKLEEQILSEIEEGHESQVSESESCETVSDTGKESPDNYEQKIFEIDEIIRQAQTNVEKFEKDIVPLKDIVGISPSTGERTPSVEPQDSLEEAHPLVDKALSTQHTVSPDKKTEEKSPDGMATSTDSLDSKPGKDLMASSSDSLEDNKRRQDLMSASLDSIESARRDLMVTSADSLGRDDSSGREGDISSGSERVPHIHGIMEGSTDSLEPTSSQATHATYQYETDSVMSGSFTSGCSTTLMPSGDEISDLMSASMYIPEGELRDDSLGGASSYYEWIKTRPETVVKETILEEPSSEFSRTVTKTVTLPPEVKQMTFTGPDAQEKLKRFMDEFNAGEHTSETETVDEAGNVHVQKIVQKRIVMDPTSAEEEGLIESEPQIEESVSTDKHGNVTRVVRRTVISTHTVEIDLDTGEPIIHRESSPAIASPYSSSSVTVTPQSSSPHLSSHLTGPPSGSHSPREPLPTSLEPNTASGTGLQGVTGPPFTHAPLGEFVRSTYPLLCSLICMIKCCCMLDLTAYVVLLKHTLLA